MEFGERQAGEDLTGPLVEVEDFNLFLKHNRACLKDT